MDFIFGIIQIIAFIFVIFVGFIGYQIIWGLIINFRNIQHKKDISLSIKSLKYGIKMTLFTIVSLAVLAKDTIELMRNGSVFSIVITIILLIPNVFMIIFWLYGILNVTNVDNDE